MTEKIGLEVIILDKDFQDGIKAIEKGIDRMVDSFQEGALVTQEKGAVMDEVFGNVIAEAAIRMADAVVAAVKLVGQALLDLGKFSFETAVEVESAFTGVLKTTDGLSDEFGNLTADGEAMLQQFRDLAKEVPVPIEEMMRIGEVAGQLGVAEKSLVGFVEKMIWMGDATDLSSEMAASSIATLQSIFEVSTDDMIEQAERLGSAIVYLGNNYNTNEPKIMAWADRIGAAARIAGMSQADILGIGAAFSSVGSDAGEGGRGVAKVLGEINKAIALSSDKLIGYAETAGMTADEFAAMWETDAIGAFDAFVKGLGEAGDDAQIILDELGLRDANLLKAFLSLAGAGDRLTDSVRDSNQAWDENAALAAEAALRYATVESQMAVAKNQLKDVALTIGMAMLPSFVELLNAAKPVIEKLGEELPAALEALKPLFEIALANAVPLIEDLGEMIPTIVDGIVALGNALESMAAGDIGIEIDPSLIAIWQKMRDMMQGLAAKVLPFFVAQADKIGAWFKANKPLIQDFLAVVAERFGKWADGVVAAWDVIEPLLSGLMDIILELVQFVMQLVTGDWAGAWQSVGDIVSIALVTIYEVIAAGLEFIAGLFGSSLEEIAIIWSGIWNNLSIIIGAVWEDIKSRVTAGMALVRWVFTDGTTAIRDAAVELWEEITTVITENVDSIQGSITDRVETIKSNWQTAWQNMKKKVVSTLAGILLTIIMKIATIRSNLETKLAEILEEWRAKWEEIKEAAIEIVGGIVSGIDDKMSDVSNKIVGKLASALKDAKSKAKDFIEVGFNIVNGIIAGIQEKAGALFDAIWNLILGAIGAANEAAGAESPSKKMAELGRNLDEGLIIGMESLARQAIDTAAGLATATISGAQAAATAPVMMNAPPVILQGGSSSVDRSINATFENLTPEEEDDQLVRMQRLSILRG